MQGEQVFRRQDALPPAQGWRVPSWSLWLLALLPLSGLLLPFMPEHGTGAVRGKHVARDPFAIDFDDGRRLVCDSCRSLSAQWRTWKPQGGLTRETSRVKPAEPRTIAPAAAPGVSAPPVVIPDLRALRAAALYRSLPRHPVAAGFNEDIEELLPRYRGEFEQAARRNGLDWRLLAAVGYQESRWNPAAESPTGVRGLMMLTTGTALDLGVDRDDASQSIRGAGRFLQGLYRQLPRQIREPDRTWMALAAYNQGIGHLLDARDVAVNLGGNPNHWSDVRQALPLLSDEVWLKTTKYGFARGGEAVAFVDGVRQYYAGLAVLTQPAEAANANAPHVVPLRIAGT